MTQHAITLLDAKGTEKLIVSIKGRSTKLDNDIHLAACSAMQHHAKHGDITLLNRLAFALPKSARRNALFAWAVAFDGKCMMSTDKENPLVHVKGDGVVDVDGAIAMPFWEYAPEAEYRQFDLKAALANLLKKAESSLVNAEQDTALVQPDVLAALRALTVTPEAIIVSDTVLEEQE